jgi:hypothetical protein
MSHYEAEEKKILSVRPFLEEQKQVEFSAEFWTFSQV